ncbi:cardiolipin synthase B [Parahaliea sp. F7430]|uniref:Cardiolipin synthase B n=1 Tax=Sediminihaliea albiluteola TaxID=2758564 RepID=A0A7W2TWC7_9GAMM|nr:phospholipase D-like domain-containing protein [Sediminihaliea albiluteola]MBA6413175.1 cardiolipin synthase B [Sediminihaliea albiluteola]
MQLLQIPVILFALLSILTQSSCALQSDEHGIDSMSPRDGTGRSGSHHTNAVIKDISDQADAKSMAMAQTVPYLDVLSKVPIYRDNYVELLIDGPATLTSMMRAIQAAEHYIYLETYIFESSEEGRLFAEALAEKSRQGIVVNVIYDSVGSMASDVKMFEMMDASGVSLIEYHPVDPTEGGNPLDINNRNHRKLLVVDGLIGFTGGVNLSSAYGSGSKPGRRRDPIREGWRDTHIAVKGPVVQGFEQEFLNHWRSQGGQVAAPQEPVSSPAVGDAVVAIVSSKGGDDQGSEIFAAYQDAMRRAKHSIWITQAYFAPSDDFLTLLEQAVKRGVDVRLLLPGVSDSKLVLNASRSRYTRLLRAGVRIYENQQAVLHAKTAVIDGIWSTVGSSNLDYRSFLHNDEINAIILGLDFAKVMEAQFRKDLSSAPEITLRDWKRRPLWQRITERLSWVIEYWL